MNIIARISVRLIHVAFNTRYWLAARTTNHPRFAKLVKKIAFDKDDMIVLPKNNTVSKTIDLNIEIENGGERNVVPSDLIKKVLMRSDKIFLMNFCICRQSNKCKDFPHDHGCIFLGDATEKIPKDYGRYITPEESCDFIDECSRLGLVHIIGRNKLDKVWLNLPRKQSMMTICNCCPCCCLWNMVRDIHGSIGSVFTRMDGVTITVDKEKCIGCGICMERCFMKAIKITDGKCELDDSMCRGCGRCTEECPVDAIKIEFDPGVIDREADRIYDLLVPPDN